MRREFKPGQRVRVTVRNRMAGHQPGDKGTVLRASELSATGDRYSSVAMDIDNPAHSSALFTEGEIEADLCD